MIALHVSDRQYAPLFDDLYSYIHEALLTEAGIDPDADDFDVMEAIRACEGKFVNVRQFCDETDVSFTRLEALLNDNGAYCDCEVMLNCMDAIDPEAELPLNW